MNLESRINKIIAIGILTTNLALISPLHADTWPTPKKGTEIIEVQKKREPLENYVLSEEHENPKFKKAFTISTIQYLRKCYKKPGILKMAHWFMKAQRHIVVTPIQLWEELLYNQLEWVGTIANASLTGDSGFSGFKKLFYDKLWVNYEKIKQNHPEVLSRKMGKEFLDMGIAAGGENLRLLKNNPFASHELTFYYLAGNPKWTELAPKMLENWFNFGDYTLAGKEILNNMTRQNFGVHEFEIADKKIIIDEKNHKITIDNITFDEETQSLVFGEKKEKESYEEKKKRLKHEINNETIHGLSEYEPYKQFFISVASKKAVNQLTIKRLEYRARELLAIWKFKCERDRLWSNTKKRKKAYNQEQKYTQNYDKNGVTVVTSSNFEKIRRKRPFSCAMMGTFSVDEYGKVKCSIHSPKEKQSNTTARPFAQNETFLRDSPERTVKMFIVGCRKMGYNSTAYHLVRYTTAGSLRNLVNQFDKRGLKNDFIKEFSQYRRCFNVKKISDNEVNVQHKRGNAYTFTIKKIDRDYRITSIEEH